MKTKKQLTDELDEDNIRPVPPVDTRPVYPPGTGSNRCPMCGSLFWFFGSSRFVWSTGVAMENKCSHCGHMWLTAPTTATESIRDLMDELSRLRSKLAEKGGHRG